MTWRLQFAEEGPTLWVKSDELLKTLRRCERLINSIMNLSCVYPSRPNCHSELNCSFSVFTGMANASTGSIDEKSLTPCCMSVKIKMETESGEALSPPHAVSLFLCTLSVPTFSPWQPFALPVPVLSIIVCPPCPHVFSLCDQVMCTLTISKCTLTVSKVLFQWWLSAHPDYVLTMDLHRPKVNF